MDIRNKDYQSDFHRDKNPNILDIESPEHNFYKKRRKSNLNINFDFLNIENSLKIISISSFVFFISLFLPWIEEKVPKLSIHRTSNAFEGQASIAAVFSFIFLISIITLIYSEIKGINTDFIYRIGYGNLFLLLGLQLLLLSYIQYSFYTKSINTDLYVGSGSYVGMISSGFIILGSLLKKKNEQIR